MRHSIHVKNSYASTCGIIIITFCIFTRDALCTSVSENVRDYFVENPSQWGSIRSYLISSPGCFFQTAVTKTTTRWLFLSQKNGHCKCLSKLSGNSQQLTISSALISNLLVNSRENRVLKERLLLHSLISSRLQSIRAFFRDWSQALDKGGLQDSIIPYEHLSNPDFLDKLP